MTDSGLNRTQQTAIGLQRGNADAQVRRDQQAYVQQAQQAIDQIMADAASQKMQNESSIRQATENWYTGALASAQQAASTNAKGTEGYAMAQEIAAKLEQGKTPTAYQLGRMLLESTSVQAMRARTIEGTILDSARKLGVDEKTAESVSALMVRADRAAVFVAPETLQTVGKDGEVNQFHGQYMADGTVAISAGITTEEALEFVLKHELTHAIEGSEAYGKLQQLVRKSMGEEAYSAAVEQAQQERSDRGDTQGARNPEAEVVADWIAGNLYRDGFARIIRNMDGGAAIRFRAVLDNIQRALGLTKNFRQAAAIRSAERAFAEVLQSDYSRTENETAAETGDGQFVYGTAQEDITREYEKMVDGILNGTINTKDAVILGYTPELYRDLGMPNIPFVIGAGHVYSIAKTKSEAIAEGKYNSKTYYHGYGAERVKNLYEALQDPVAIIASLDKLDKTGAIKKDEKLRSVHSVVAIVDIGSKTKHQLIAVEITAERMVDGKRMDVNVLSSAYDKNVKGLFKEAIALENIGDIGIYYAKKEATNLIGAGVQFPKRLQEMMTSNPIIRSFDQKVNRKISDVIESLQFKRWFGDWQNNPKNASKVVNADGTPMVVYHGTNSEAFYVFDSSQSSKRVRLNTLGDGYYFTSSQDTAERYGKNVMSVYLDMKKPYRVYARDGGIRAQMAEDFHMDADSISRNDIQSILKAHGYDGVLLYDSKYAADNEFSTAVVFKNTQIKSATDNVGTFDGRNPDIRYSYLPADLQAKEEAAAAEKAENARRLAVFLTCILTGMLLKKYGIFRYFSLKRETKTEKLKCLRSQQYQSFTGVCNV